MTITSPSLIVPFSRASIAPCSRSKTRAGPSKTSTSIPAFFTTAPSGASEPPRIVMPPPLLIGFFVARRISPSGSGGEIVARFSAMVLPVTVRQSPCKRPASRSAFNTTGIPPTLSRSVMTKRPKGLRSASSGVFALIRWKSSRVRSTSASCAIARRCRTEFVEPPKAMTAVIAFSKAFFVMIWRAVIPFRINSTTASPDLMA